MKLTFIGSGSAFTTDGNYHSNMLLENEKQDRLLLDCGTDARHALFDLGLTHKDINTVYVSHLHADHAGGLEWLGFTRKFDPSCELATLFITESLVETLWRNVLAGGMHSIKDVNCTLSTYFNVQAVRVEDNCFVWQGQRFDLIPVTHVFDNVRKVPCCGLRYEINGRKIWWTADLVFNPADLLKHYQEADLIFHDCETTPFPSSVHPNYQELLQLPVEIKRKIWLYHYNPGTLPNAKKEGFKGFVQKGQSFDLTQTSTFK